MEKFGSGLEKMIESIMVRLPSIGVGVLILILGSYIIRFIIQIVQARFEKRNVDLSIRDFIASILRFVLWAMLLLTAASTMGIQTTSFLAVLSAASLAIGLSLQGSLANLAGGVLILLFKPFRVGDNITSSSGANGTVQHIDILYTTLRTADGIQVTAPNGNLANAVVNNFSSLEKRRIEYIFRIPYNVDIRKAREVALTVFKADERILKEETVEILVSELGDNFVSLTLHAWASKADYSAAYFDNFEALKYAFQEQGIKTPNAIQEIKVLNSVAV